MSAIEGKETIQYLELWCIRGLSDISVVSSLTGLQYLFLQDLRYVARIPDLSKLIKLRRIHLENMKGLKDVSAIRHAPALEQFVHISAQNISPEKYRDLLLEPSLRELLVAFGSQKKNREFEDLAMLHGKSKYLRTQFIFQ